MKWFGGGSSGSPIPTPQTLLRSVYIGRVCVAVAVYLAAALKFAVAEPLDLLVTSLLLVTTVVVTIASYWYTHFRGRSPGQTFLYAQALFDVALITAVVHITGGPQSDLTPLYVPPVGMLRSTSSASSRTWRWRGSCARSGSRPTTCCATSRPGS